MYMHPSDAWRLSSGMSSALEVNAALSEFAADVRTGLLRAGQKELPSKYLYDSLGSALFEAITHLGEYGLSRADMRLIQRHASEIGAAVQDCSTVVELGAGSGRKTRHILAALDRPVYFPVDVSAAALEANAAQMEGLAEVRPIEGDYLNGVAEALSIRAHGNVLVLFLGSTIGNYGGSCGVDLLRGLRGRLRAGDALLIGADLVKSPEILLRAYDDETGVTAAFNKNLLARINRELAGRFDLNLWQHEARYDRKLQRVEMHLRSLAAQTVTIDGAAATVRFAAGETIWTESSHKYTLEGLRVLAGCTGWHVRQVWVDREWPFAESLWTAI